MHRAKLPIHIREPGSFSTNPMGMSAFELVRDRLKCPGRGSQDAIHDEHLCTKRSQLRSYPGIAGKRGHFVVVLRRELATISPKRRGRAGPFHECSMSESS